jgi:hypothetical protein
MSKKLNTNNQTSSIQKEVNLYEESVIISKLILDSDLTHDRSALYTSFFLKMNTSGDKNIKKILSLGRTSVISYELFQRIKNPSNILTTKARILHYIQESHHQNNAFIKKGKVSNIYKLFLLILTLISLPMYIMIGAILSWLYEDI